MQVTETSSAGLKREFKVVLQAEELATKLETQLADLKGKVRINGFRPGKVPVAHLKRVYGRSIMGDVVQEAVTEANKKIVEENSLRLALEPRFDFPGGRSEMEKVMEAKGDLAFTVAFETLPKVEVGSFDDVKLERLVADVPEAEVEQVLDRMANQNRTYTPKEGGAEKGDKLTVDFVGKIGGEPFEGGAGTDVDVILGSNTFIPGFEDQVLGMKAGDNRTVTATFPENYLPRHLAGKEATFDVTAKGVAAPGELAIDDAFAKGFNFDSLEAMKTAIRGNLEAEWGRASREKLKRALLDALDKKYSFELPAGLVDQEFEGIWKQVEAERAQTGKSFADEGTTEEDAQADYRRIAERRVRLGLLLAEVGEKAEVKVDDNEVTQALVQRARAFPGQEQAVWDHYRKNPEALAELRAPIFEDKVVDHIIAQAKVSDRKVGKDELFRMEEEKEEKEA
ncbi:MAG: trigger factor [Methylobacteriaceae bacterium]|jgi:trigger factor|nr:trigger factor [Methylobacteriaceae bacterium]